MNWRERFQEARNEFEDDLSELQMHDEEFAVESMMKLADLGNEMHEEPVLHCVRKYTEAEMDFESPGERGIGRLSTAIPRYGAYFRKHLRKLTPAALESLEQRVVVHLASGYCAHKLLMDVSIQDPEVLDGEALFKSWIPAIYSAGLKKSFSRDAFVAIDMLTSNSVKRHKRQLAELGIRGGSLFRRDKTEEILSYHCFAGFSLRHMEYETAVTDRTQ